MAQLTGMVTCEHTRDTAPSCHSRTQQLSKCIVSGMSLSFYGKQRRETRAPSYQGCGEGKHEINVYKSARQVPDAQQIPKEHSRTYAVIVYYSPAIFRFVQKLQLSMYSMSGSFQVDDKTANKLKSLLSEYLPFSRGTENVEIKHTCGGKGEEER